MNEQGYNIFVMTVPPTMHIENKRTIASMNIKHYYLFKWKVSATEQVSEVWFGDSISPEEYADIIHTTIRSMSSRLLSAYQSIDKQTGIRICKFTTRV